MKLALRLQDVSFAYDQRKVLEDVSLEIPEGSFVSIIGPNGGGKSTLLKLILGLLEPTSGRIEVFGASPRRMRHRIGTMPQSHRLDTLFPITVEEVVRLGRLSSRTFFGIPSAADRVAVDQALERTRCAHLRNESFATLSGGQRQLVLIARALVSGPDMLLLDEPTANLDPAVEDAFYTLLNELKGQMTIALVSHDVGLVAKHSEEVVCVSRTVEIHPAHEITADVVARMFGEDGALIVDHSHGHAHGPSAGGHHHG